MTDAKPAIVAPPPREGKPFGWQRELAEAITDPGVLHARLGLPADLLPSMRRAARLFPLKVTASWLARIRPGEPEDPLLRQVLPLDIEAAWPAGYSADPVGDLAARRSTGLIQKYAGRALLVTTGACAVHCRYCFRREFPYGSETAGRSQWRRIVSELASAPDITEIILSGGDPLSLSDPKLAALIEQLERVPGLRRLRIHTRLPIVLPSRVDRRLTAWLEATRLDTAVVVHANHPAELNAEVVDALGRLRATGAVLFNQAVLLAGVNDDATVLANLSESLFGAGAVPYYLHLLDPVRGAAHFDVPLERARGIHEQLMTRLPGYLVPKLVRETPGNAFKTPAGAGMEC